MRIVIDLDGTICPIKKEHQHYSDLEPLPGAVEKIVEIKELGHYIIIMTARNMATQEANLGKVMKNIGKVTLDWLEKHKIPFDEIHFGKPNAHLYIDDRAFRFNSWDEINGEMLDKLSRER
jgi:capsule biosynthesis phosphatase